MDVLTRPWGAMHVRIEGPTGAPAVLFANSLGTDLRVWDAVLPHLPAGLRLLRFDKRGHGLSDAAPGPLTVADLAGDAAALLDAAGVQGRVAMVGLSIGGLIGQALAALRPLDALVLVGSAARMGSPETWQARIAAVQAGGMAAIADAVMDRWFAPAFRATPALRLWRNMLLRCDPAGYTAACGALAAADLTEAAARLALPVLAVSGAADGAAPPDLVAATAARIPGARHVTLDAVGHIPSVEDPQALAAALVPFLKEHLDV